MKDAVRVHRLLLHAASQLEKESCPDDLVLDVISAGFEVQQFITTDDINAETDITADLGWRDAIQQAFEVVAAWSADTTAKAAFAIRMDDLRRAATSGSAS